MSKGLTIFLGVSLIIITFLIFVKIFKRQKRQCQFYLQHRRIRQISSQLPLEETPFEFSSHFPEQDFYLGCIGDISCSYNARSVHLRCAVNPDGPCENCPSYTKEMPTE